jgi:predicted nucleic acid-binding protein
VQLVIADTGPVNYLILIGHIGLLPALFEKIILPVAVQAELTDPGAPSEVRAWIGAAPPWVEVRDAKPILLDDEVLGRLEEGERSAINLAMALGGDLLLMDDRKGVLAARSRGFGVIGTIGILDLAARRSLIDLPAAIALLRQTNFRRSEALLDALLEKHASTRGENEGK